MAISAADSQRLTQQIEQEKHELALKESTLRDVAREIARLKEDIAKRESEMRRATERTKAELTRKEGDARKLESEITRIRANAQKDEHELLELRRRLSDMTRKSPFKRAA